MYWGKSKIPRGLGWCLFSFAYTSIAASQIEEDILDDLLYPVFKSPAHGKVLFSLTQELL